VAKWLAPPGRLSWPFASLVIEPDYPRVTTTQPARTSIRSLSPDRRALRRGSTQRSPLNVQRPTLKFQSNVTHHISNIQDRLLPRCGIRTGQAMVAGTFLRSGSSGCCAIAGAMGFVWNEKRCGSWRADRDRARRRLLKSRWPDDNRAIDR
jgi:hypothetical protein